MPKRPLTESEKILLELEEQKQKEAEQALMESVFQSLTENFEPPKPKNIKVTGNVNSVEITYEGKKFKSVTEKYVDSSTKKLEVLIEKLSKENMLMENRLRNLEKLSTSMASTNDRLERTNSTLQQQNKNLESKIKTLMQDIKRFRLDR